MKSRNPYNRGLEGHTKLWLGACSIAVSAFTASPAVRAANIWDGGGTDGFWNTVDNWDNNAVPGTAALTFVGNLQNNTNNNLVGTDLSFGGINFTNDGTSGKTNAFTLAGNRITLSGNVSTTAGASTDIIDLDLIFAGNRTFNIVSGHNLTINGLISETGGSRNLIKAAGATLTLSNPNNSFSGQVQINNGNLSVNGIADVGNNSALGKGSSVRIGNSNASASLTFSAGASSTDRQVQIGAGADTAHTGGARIYNNTDTGSGALIFSNTNFNILDTTATVSRTLTLGGLNGDANAIDGIIANNSTGGTIALTKADAGNWTLSKTNTYTGATNVNGGKLIIDGNISTSSLTTVAVGATLGGSGTVGKTVINGTLAVGNSPGKMDFTDTLGLNGIAVMEIDGMAGAGLAGGHDFTNLTGVGAAGALTYGGTMSLDIGVIFGAGTYSWDLFNMASETGTFTTITLSDQYSGSLLDGDANGVWDLSSGSNTWQFTESSGVLDLTVVPEPNAAMLIGGLGMLTLLRRRRD